MKNILFNNILTDANYTVLHELPKEYKLTTSVLSYFTGNEWRCISIIPMLKHLILHDQYIDSSSNRKHDISVILCPITMMSCVVDGKFYPKKLDKMLICENDKKEEFNFFSSNFKKREIEIKKIRNLFVDHPDLKYIMSNNQKTKFIISKSYYKNNLNFNNTDYSDKLKKKFIVHPKSLVYLLEYIESTTNKKKYTIILGKSLNKNLPKGYNGESSGINKYIQIHNNELRYKNGFIFQILFVSAISMFPHSKLIKL